MGAIELVPGVRVAELAELAAESGTFGAVVVPPGLHHRPPRPWL